MYEHFLYHHVKRPEWGFSTIVVSQDESTTFLFDDGRQRKILTGHMHLMQLATLPDAEAEQIHRKLAKHTHAQAREAAKRKKGSSRA
jgi:metal-dependent hydrolase (beta-lactamase superfamily II)